ncbi:MAG: hypothetical protein P8170_23630 [Gemmatimonadota bacterium]
MSQKPFSRTPRVVTLGLLVLGALGCATARTTHESPSTGPAESAVLRVENHGFSSAQIHLVWNDTVRIPLGSVEPAGNRIWTLPPAGVRDGPGARSGSFRLEARFRPARNVSLGPVRLVADGSQWVWQLKHDRALATFVVLDGDGPPVCLPRGPIVCLAASGGIGGRQAR